MSGNSRRVRSAPRAQEDNTLLPGKVAAIHGASDILDPQSREEVVELLNMWENS